MVGGRGWHSRRRHDDGRGWRLAVDRGRLDGCWALLLLEDGIVAETVTLRFFAVVASRVRFVALVQACHVRMRQADGHCVR